MSRLDEEEPRALAQTQTPVTRFPDFVRYLVQRLSVLCASMGKVKIAQVLCRAGLHLNSATVARMLAKPPTWAPAPVAQSVTRIVTAKRPNHAWQVDLTTVPICSGFWTTWSPFARWHNRDRPSDALQG
jgi:hypothetical protein